MQHYIEQKGMDAKKKSLLALAPLTAAKWAGILLCTVQTATQFSCRIWLIDSVNHIVQYVFKCNESIHKYTHKIYQDSRLATYLL